MTQGYTKPKKKVDIRLQCVIIVVQIEKRERENMTLSKGVIANMFSDAEMMEIGQVCRLLTPSSETETGFAQVEVTRLTAEYFTVENV